MAWLERNAPKRVDPQQVLPGAGASSPSRRVTTVPRANAHCQWQSGFIARYARYADYHEVLGERLKPLTQFVNELGGPGTRSLWYVDTGPLLERDLAQRAGLGFIGKHTNLISRQLGNWFFLSEITHHAGTGARRAGDEPLRLLHALHRRLPDRGDHRAVPTRCAALHFLSDHRIARQHSPELRLRSATAFSAATIAWRSARGTALPTKGD